MMRELNREPVIETKELEKELFGEFSRDLQTQVNQWSSHDGKSKTEILQQAGISTRTANRFELIAKLPLEVFEDFIAEAKFGELLSEMELNKGIIDKQRGNSDVTTLKDIGITKKVNMRRKVSSIDET